MASSAQIPGTLPEGVKKAFCERLGLAEDSFFPPSTGNKAIFFPHLDTYGAGALPLTFTVCVFVGVIMAIKRQLPPRQIETASFLRLRNDKGPARRNRISLKSSRQATGTPLPPMSTTSCGRFGRDHQGSPFDCWSRRIFGSRPSAACSGYSARGQLIARKQSGSRGISSWPGQSAAHDADQSAGETAGFPAARGAARGPQVRICAVQKRPRGAYHQRDAARRSTSGGEQFQEERTDPEAPHPEG